MVVISYMDLCCYKDKEQQLPDKDFHSYWYNPSNKSNHPWKYYVPLGVLRVCMWPCILFFSISVSNKNNLGSVEETSFLSFKSDFVGKNCNPLYNFCTFLFDFVPSDKRLCTFHEIHKECIFPLPYYDHLKHCSLTQTTAMYECHTLECFYSKLPNVLGQTFHKDFCYQIKFLLHTQAAQEYTVPLNDQLTSWVLVTELQ